MSIIRPMTGHSEARQRAAVAPHAPSVEYVIGRDCATWRDAVRSVRRGDVIVVEALALLPEPKSRKLIPSMDMRDAVEEIERRGGSLLEARTGRSSLMTKDRAAMIADAARSLGSGGRSLSSMQARANGAAAGAKRGRPKAEFTPEQIEAARRVWESRKVERWEDAAKMLPRGFTVWRARKMFGARGK